MTQLLLIREFLATFQGNEFVIALGLFVWLALGGAGTWLARAASGAAAGTTRLGWLSLVLAALSPATILGVRGLRDVFFVHGASVGFYPTLAYVFAAAAPLCLLVGFLLPYSLHAARAARPGYPGVFVYMADGLGDVAGGALFAFLLVHLLTPLAAICVANLPLVAAAGALIAPGRRVRALAAAAAALGVLIGGVLLERRSLAPGPGTLVHYRESRHGRITVFRDREQLTLFRDGAPAASTEDRGLAEEIVHFPLSQLRRADSVLLISAVGGMLDEVAKHRPARVDYVELDPQVSEAQFAFGLLRPIPGLRVVNEDGRRWLAAAGGAYDAILVNLGEPQTFQANRFFTERFFALAKRRLAPGGIVAFTAEGYGNALTEQQRRTLSILRATAATSFANVLALPGRNVSFLCRDQPLDPDVPGLLRRKRVTAENIEAYFAGDVTAERIAQLDEALDRSAPPNRDETPRLMRAVFAAWFAKFGGSPVAFAAALGVAAAAYLARLRRQEFVLFATGAVAMGAEILVIFAFQIYFGYIYLQIGLIVTVFLAGLLPGAWLGSRAGGRGGGMLVATDLLLIALLGAFGLAVLSWGDRLPAGFFLAFGLAVSVACGFQFPAALRLGGDAAPAAARAFSADLVGAACGTLATSLVLIPYLGLLPAALCLAGLKAASLAAGAGLRAAA